MILLDGAAGCSALVGKLALCCAGFDGHAVAMLGAGGIEPRNPIIWASVSGFMVWVLVVIASKKRQLGIIWRFICWGSYGVV